jgi:formate hydrogenlyase subunit 4
MREDWIQLVQVVLILAVAPFLTGLVRLVKSRLNQRQGPSVWQPYRDLWRLMRKDAVLAHNASWLFRVAPYLIFTAIWLAASIIPTFSTNLLLAPIADLIALVALLGSARFLLALAGMDIGTSFGGLGSSREMMIAALAEPAMLMVTLTLSLFVGSTSLTHIAIHFLTHDHSISVSLALGLAALSMVSIAENARIPVDNPATHLELTMVHEAMVLEYSGRHLAMIEAASMLKLVLYISLIADLFAPWGIAVDAQDMNAIAIGIGSYILKLVAGGVVLAAFETSIAKMRVFRVAEFLGAAMMLGILGVVFLYIAQGL